jgi:serine/threonine-protein kinase HipA
MSVAAIEASIWGMRIGVVAPAARARAYTFQYYPDWLNRGIDLAPLHMPVGNHVDLWTFREAPPSFQGLPGLLADALPDSFGNRLINAWMSGRGIDPNSVTVLDRLAYMGKRGMGALEFEPAEGPKPEASQPLEMRHLVEEARRVVRGTIGNDAAAQAALANLIQVGTSAGGARPKAVIALQPSTHEIRSGQFEVPAGFEHWLVKFDGIGPDLDLGVTKEYGRIEYAYHLMATAGAGITMAPCRLLEENGRAHFMTRRFDRQGNLKHHLQSLGALDHLDYQQTETNAYEQLFLACKALHLDDDGLAEAFRRMAFNVMSRNCDDHVKNFAFRLIRSGAWELAPAYDIIHAYNPESRWTRRHQMSVNRKFEQIGWDDLMTIARRFSVPAAAEILGRVRAALESWAQFARQAGLSDAARDRIARDFELLGPPVGKPALRRRRP